MKARLEKDGWERVLEVYRKVWKDAFGDYDMSEFTFSFRGDDRSGEVVITFREKELPGLRVTREGDQWKVDER